jgi:acyl carrier protein
LKEICNKTDNWKQRAKKALNDGFSGIYSADTLYQLIYEAEEEFNIRLDAEGLELVKSVK